MQPTIVLCVCNEVAFSGVVKGDSATVLSITVVSVESRVVARESYGTGGPDLILLVNDESGVDRRCRNLVYFVSWGSTVSHNNNVGTSLKSQLTAHLRGLFPSVVGEERKVEYHKRR